MTPAVWFCAWDNSTSSRNCFNSSWDPICVPSVFIPKGFRFCFQHSSALYAVYCFCLQGPLVLSLCCHLYNNSIYTSTDLYIYICTIRTQIVDGKGSLFAASRGGISAVPSIISNSAFAQPCLHSHWRHKHYLSTGCRSPVRFDYAVVVPTVGRTYGRNFITDNIGLLEGTNHLDRTQEVSGKCIMSTASITRWSRNRNYITKFWIKF